MPALFLQPDVDVLVREQNIVLARKGVFVSHVLGVAEALALTSLECTGEIGLAT